MTPLPPSSLASWCTGMRTGIVMSRVARTLSGRALRLMSHLRTVRFLTLGFEAAGINPIEAIRSVSNLRLSNLAQAMLVVLLKSFHQSSARQSGLSTSHIFTVQCKWKAAITPAPGAWACDWHRRASGARKATSDRAGAGPVCHERTKRAKRLALNLAQSIL